jgi:hypothetical protein
MNTHPAIRVMAKYDREAAKQRAVGKGKEARGRRAAGAARFLPARGDSLAKIRSLSDT